MAVQELQNLFAVVRRFDIRIFVNYCAVFVDDERPARFGHAANQLDLLIVHCACNFAAGPGGHAKSLGNDAVGIGRQGKVQVMRLLEIGRVLHAVAADADHLCLILQIPPGHRGRRTPGLYSLRSSPASFCGENAVISKKYIADAERRVMVIRPAKTTIH